LRALEDVVTSDIPPVRMGIHPTDAESPGADEMLDEFIVFLMERQGALQAAQAVVVFPAPGIPSVNMSR
jgi:hypothetical protein